MSKRERKENLETFIRNEVLVDSDSKKIYEPEDLKKIIRWVKKQSDQIEAFTSYFNLGDWFYYRAEDTRFSPVAFLEDQLPKEQPSKVIKRGKKNDNIRNMEPKVERQHRATRKLENTTSTRRPSKNTSGNKKRVVSSNSRCDSKKSSGNEDIKKRKKDTNKSSKTGRPSKTRGARK